MFKNRLKALDYMYWDKVNGNDTEHARKLVSWLEDQKIRHYRIEDRKDLRDVTSENWPQAFEKYCNDVECPAKTCLLDRLEWIVGLAIKLDYEDNFEKYQAVKSNTESQSQRVAPSIKSTNPLDNLDFESQAFKDGVNSLATLLKIPRHPNHLITLEACSKLVTKRLNPAVVQDPKSIIVEGKPFPIMDISFGKDLGDSSLNNAAKILNLLYIQDLRELQTKINETIVAVQNVTANPKTDTRLGQVGKK